MAMPIRNDQPAKHFPWVTVALLAINIVVFLFIQPAGFQFGADPESISQEQIWLAQDADVFSYQWGTVACEITTGEAVVTAPEGCRGDRSEVLPESKAIFLALLTCMFLHGSILHLAGNMLFLWVFGKNVEDRLGPVNYLVLYLVGGVISTLGFVALNRHLAAPLLGASGAIAVAMGAYLALFPRARVLTVIFTAAFQVVYVPAAVVLLLFFVTQFITNDDMVAVEAHAVGMIAGFVGALVLARIPAVRRRALDEAADADLRIGANF